MSPNQMIEIENLLQATSITTSVPLQSQGDEEPRVPPEIIYDILLLAYYNDPPNHTTLLQVAKSTSEW